MRLGQQLDFFTRCFRSIFCFLERREHAGCLLFSSFLPPFDAAATSSSSSSIAFTSFHTALEAHQSPASFHELCPFPLSLLHHVTRPSSSSPLPTLAGSCTCHRSPQTNLIERRMPSIWGSKTQNLEFTVKIENMQSAH